MRGKILKFAALVVLFGIGARAADASIVFTFAEAGGTVTMTSSGTLDTTKLLPVVRPDGWGGTGIEDNVPGDIDMMGGTVFGQIDKQFGFSAGTDASAITNPGGPFTFDDVTFLVVTGSKSFTTYSGFDDDNFRVPGIGVVGADIVGGLWTPDQNWVYSPGTTFADLGLNVGTYSVFDSETSEGITIQVGAAAAVPEPASLAIWSCIGIAGLVASRRRKGLLASKSLSEIISSHSLWFWQLANSRCHNPFQNH